MALRGVRVLEVAGLAPAPFCGMVMADFGASVLKVDRAHSVDVECLGSGKRSIVLDLKQTKGKEVFRRLCAESDVLIEPFRKGVMERLGLGPDEILTLNPRLIYARLTGFGQSGQLSSMAGHDINYVASSGVLSLLGRAGAPPTPSLNLLADFAGGGLMCAMGIVLALYERTQSGRGQVVDAAMTEGVAYLSSWVLRSRGRLPIWDKERGENMLDSGAHFYDTYETKDGRFISVGAIEPQFYAELLRKLGLDAAQVPQFTEWPQGKQVLGQRFKEKTMADWAKLFTGSDACVTPVLTPEEAARLSHSVDRNAFKLIQRADGDLEVVPQPAPQLSRTPGRTHATDGEGPFIPGKDSRAVLQGLGYSDTAIDKMVEDGVTSCADPANVLPSTPVSKL